MNKLAFFSAIKKEVSFWKFAMDHNNMLVVNSIISIIAGFKLFGYMHQKITDSSWLEKVILEYFKNENMISLFINLNFFIGFCFAVTLVNGCFIFNHISFLKNYSFKHFKISRSGKISDDIWFIITFSINIIILGFISNDLVYRIALIYLIQITALYFLLKINYCSYKLSFRTNPLKTLVLIQILKTTILWFLAPNREVVEI
ncbi:MAG: hypothetical protein RCG15_05490 [Candidatus Rickettsia vulgarisii]